MDSTYYTVAGATLTGLTASDDYLLVAKACIGNTQSTAVNGMRLAVGGVEILGSEQLKEDPISGTAAADDYYFSRKYTSDGSNVDLQAMFTGGTGYVPFFMLMAINLTDLGTAAQYVQNASGSSDVAVDTWEEATSVVTLQDRASDYLVFSSITLQIDDSAVMIQHGLSIDGTEKTLGKMDSEDVTEELQLGGVFLLKSTGTTQTVVPVWQNDLSATTDQLQASICCIRLNSFEDKMAERSDTGVAIDDLADDQVQTISKVVDTTAARTWALYASSRVPRAGGVMQGFIETNEDDAGLVTRAGREDAGYNGNDANAEHWFSRFGTYGTIADGTDLDVHNTFNEQSGGSHVANDNITVAYTTELVSGFDPTQDYSIPFPAADVSTNFGSLVRRWRTEVSNFITAYGAVTNRGIQEDFRDAMGSYLGLTDAQTKDLSVQDIWVKYIESL